MQHMEISILANDERNKKIKTPFFKHPLQMVTYKKSTFCLA